MVSTIIEYDEELKKDKILRNIYDEYSDINVKDKKDENGLYTEEALNLIDKKLINETKNRFHLLFGRKFQIERVLKFQKILKKYNITILLISWTGCFLSIIASELNITFFPENGDENNLSHLIIQYDKQHKKTVSFIRLLNLLLTIIIIILLIIFYKICTKIEQLKCNLNSKDNIFTSGKWKFLLIEILLNSIISIPFYNSEVIISQRNKSKPKAKIFVDIIITILTLFTRGYHFIKYIIIQSRFYQYDCEKICLDCNVTMDYLFVIKAEFQEKPFLFVSVLLTESIIIFGYSVRSVEMFFMYGTESEKVQDWRYIWNGFWCIIITMSTVGFGDFYPISLLGRFIVIISSIWGNFLISMMVAALTVAVEFNNQESLSYEMIKAALAEVEYGKIGIVFFQTLIRYNNQINKIKQYPNIINSKEFKKKKSDLFKKLTKVLGEFRILKKKKNAKAKAMSIQISMQKIYNNLTIEMDKINSQLKIIDDIKILLLRYNVKQEKIKKKIIQIFKEVEEIKIFKEKYLKEIQPYKGPNYNI